VLFDRGDAFEGAVDFLAVSEVRVNNDPSLPIA